MIGLILVGRTLPGFNQITDNISKEFRTKVRTEMIDFPMTRSFDGRRKQYEAEKLLKDLIRFAPPGAEKTIFLVREDMFTENLNFVFGLAMGTICIVSTARLDPRFYGETDMSKARGLFIERVVKEVLHELGHTHGLPHCEDKKCIMVFSNSIEDVDSKGSSFCKNCAKAIYLE